MELDKALPGPHTRTLYDNRTRREAAILAQLRSGYCRLNKYLHSIRAVESNRCECGQVETVQHVMIECPRWAVARREHLTPLGSRANQLSYLLGGYQNEQLDGPIDKWKPNMEAVLKSIDFAQATGRLDRD